MIKGGTYILQAKGGDLVPCSDASGEVEEVGERVTLFKKVALNRTRLTVG
jgi:NADPH:quinone reductase-like Zn-dependent oxidoreductase